MSDDLRLLAQRATDAGIPVRLTEADGAFHVYPTGPGPKPAPRWTPSCTRSPSWPLPVEAVMPFLALIAIYAIRIARRPLDVRQPALRLHAVHSRSEGRLTVKKIQAAAGPVTPETHVFLCGPAAMVEDLAIGLRRHGVPRDHLHAEHFAFR